MSPKTAPTSDSRVIENKATTLADHSRRPRHSPSRTRESIETSVVELRLHHPTWDSRKIARRLTDLGISRRAGAGAEHGDRYPAVTAGLVNNAT